MSLDGLLATAATEIGGLVLLIFAAGAAVGALAMHAWWRSKMPRDKR